MCPLCAHYRPTTRRRCTLLRAHYVPSIRPTTSTMRPLCARCVPTTSSMRPPGDCFVIPGGGVFRPSWDFRAPTQYQYQYQYLRVMRAEQRCFPLRISRVLESARVQGFRRPCGHTMCGRRKRERQQRVHPRAGADHRRLHVRLQRDADPGRQLVPPCGRRVA